MWGFIKSVVKAVVKIVIGAAAAVFGAIGSILLFWKTKKMRLYVRILHDVDDPGLVTVAEVEDSWQRAAVIVKDKLNTRLVGYGDPHIDVVKMPAPTDVLDLVQTNLKFLSREANDFLSAQQVGWNWLPISLSFPVTVFVVRSITHDTNNWRGLFVGFFTDSIFLTPDGVKDDTTFAHEIGHAMLQHRKRKVNLMHHKATRGTHITRWQRWCFRLSRHVTFW